MALPAAPPLYVLCFVGCLVSMLGLFRSVHAAQPSYCLLAKETGPCKAAFTRYYYDAVDRKCKPFIYGGCRGNRNNFGSKTECEGLCTCTLGLDRGNRCKSARPAMFFYFDEASDTCKLSMHNGCGGNANRFGSKHACQSTCMTSMCFHKPERGRCKAAFPRFFYNHSLRVCTTFTYGGCGGNDNRFATLDQCNSVCTVPINNMQVRGAKEKERSGATPGGLWDRLERLSMNQTKTTAATDIVSNGTLCKQPPVRGPCDGYYPLLYYHAASGQCKLFVYGGCQGNLNRFASVRDCSKKCGRSSSSKTPAVVRPTVRTSLQRAIRRRTQAATPSSLVQAANAAWQAQLANSVQFRRLLAKASVRPASSTSYRPTLQSGAARTPQSGAARPAVIPKVPRDCNDPSTKQAVKFQTRLRQMLDLPPLPAFRQCPSKMPVSSKVTKRHVTAVEPKEPIPAKPAPAQVEPELQIVYVPVIKKDLTQEEICNLPPLLGTCKLFKKVFHYNKASRKCEPFIYSGCGGNENRFTTQEECLRSCEGGFYVWWLQQQKSMTV